MHDELLVLVNLSVTLVLALIFGLVTDRFKLSPIVGYLLAGVLVGPRTPGFVADRELALQFAEIGVVLLMFGVGLHFNLGDLWSVRRVAVPGATGQIAAATILGALVAVMAGLGLASGIVIGIAISVASTVVLVRVLTDNNVVDTPQGHMAVGWLIVEDIFTVLVLVVLPAFAAMGAGQEGAGIGVVGGFALAIVKIIGLAVLVMAGGRKVIPWLLGLVARSRSRELFTLTVLAIVMAIATGSAAIFGVSMALGAFLAGMVVGQTKVSHQAAADALPMRDAFAVLFFVSVGMRFDPQVIFSQPGLLVALLVIVMLAKPLAAFIIVWLLGYSPRSAFTIAVALAQIGEFSFLLSDEALRHGMLAKEAESLLVACAILSISLNPLYFRAIGKMEIWLRGRPWFWRLLSQRSEQKGTELNLQTQQQMSAIENEEPGRLRAIVIGYGPVGQTASRILNEFNIQPVVIDLNLDTVHKLSASGKRAIYGDATRHDILEAAGVRSAKYLLVTVPDVLIRTVSILTAKELNPDLHIFARARYIQERAWLDEIGATESCIEEAETALGLAILLLRQVGADESRIQSEIQLIKRELSLRTESLTGDNSRV